MKLLIIVCLLNYLFVHVCCLSNQFFLGRAIRTYKLFHAPIIDLQNNLLLLKTEMNAGHGGKSGRDGAIEEIALDYAFALKIAEKI